MNKLKDKLFITLFTILTSFILIILIIFNIQNYVSERKQILDSFTRVGLFGRNELFGSFDRFDNMPPRENRVFMDSIVYSINLDDNNEITKINNHSFNSSFSEDEIKIIVSEIIEDGDDFYLGNLYFNKYSYIYESNNYIVLIDNSSTNSNLQSMLYFSIFVMAISEVLIFFISRQLTKILVKPAEESFLKQKQFIADASHELKTPLAVIMASADNAIKNKNETKWLNNIQSESERMNKLITSLLDLSKIESKEEHFEEVNLSKLVEKSILTLESLMYEKDIKLEYNIDDNIMFNSNSDEMKQLLSILLDNAIKHSDKNGKIIVDLHKDNTKINLSIKNKGKSIKKGDEEKIFERFYRSDESRNRNDNRYGLGLAIAKSIVIKHNGVISASSSKEYTTFRIIFKK